MVTTILWQMKAMKSVKREATFYPMDRKKEWETVVAGGFGSNSRGISLIITEDTFHSLNLAGNTIGTLWISCQKGKEGCGSPDGRQFKGDCRGY